MENKIEKQECPVFLKIGKHNAFVIKQDPLADYYFQKYAQDQSQYRVVPCDYVYKNDMNEEFGR